MKINANFTHENVRHDQENEVHMVLSLEAPKKDWEKDRAPVCIVPVVDVSGSMFGDKMTYAKKSAKKLIEHLTPQDYSALVIFDSFAKLVCPVMQMTSENKQRLQNAVDKLRPGSSTNFSGGLLTALNAIEGGDLPQNINRRIVMLTDGMANAGVATTERQLVQLIDQNRKDVKISCFGYGEGASQDILASCAKAGRANYAFIQNPDDALSAFAKELGGLLSTYAQNIKIVVKASGDHILEEVISDVDVIGDKKEVTITLDEILSEETRNVVINTKLAKQAEVLPRRMSPVDLSITYDVVQPDASLKRVSEKVSAKIRFVKDGEESPADEKLDKIVALAELIKAQVEAESLAKTGQYQAADRFMRDTSLRFKNRGHIRMAYQADKLAEKVSTADLYAQSSSYLNTTKGLARGVAVSSFHAEAYSDIAELGLNASNTAQDSLMNQFKNDDDSNKTETKK